MRTALRRPNRRICLALAAIFVALLVAAMTAPRAHAADSAQTMQIEAVLGKDGALKVTETITFANAAPAEVVQRLANFEDNGNSQYRFDFAGISSQADGRATGSVSQESDYTVVKVPTGGAKVVEIAYTVKGATFGVADGSTVMRWRFLQGLSVGVDKVELGIQPPSSVTSIECKSGAPAAPDVCSAYQAGTHESQFPTVSDGPRGAGEVVVVSLRLPVNTVAATEHSVERWSLDRAFRLGPAELLTALGLLIVGGLVLWMLHRSAGRDAGYSSPTRVAEFKPVGENESEFELLQTVRPGQVGTLVDERVDPIDVTATVLDLAQRGHLLIVELPRDNDAAIRDWRLERRPGSDELMDYERRLLDALAPEGGEPATVSNVGPRLAGVIPEVQSDLYDEMVTEGWYDRRPDNTRGRWSVIGWVGLGVALVATVLLIIFTTFGLVGLVLIAIAVGLLFVGQEMPARTAKGASMLAGLMSLRHELLDEPTDRMPRGKEYAELSEVLPYAVVLGGQDRWLQAIADADDDIGTPDPDDLSWYHAPNDWNLQDFPASMNAFITVLTGTLFKRA